MCVYILIWLSLFLFLCIYTMYTYVVCICLYVSVYRCLCVCVPLSVQFMHLCIKCFWRPEFYTMHLIPHPLLIFETGSGVSRFGKGEWPERSRNIPVSVSLHSQCWGYRHALQCLGFYRRWGSKVRSSCLQSEQSAHWRLSLSHSTNSCWTQLVRIINLFPKADYF